jgi:alanyl-tRNA synthetase
LKAALDFRPLLEVFALWEITPEAIVNKRIREDLPVSVETKSLDEALRDGALAFFGERNGDAVKVYSIGNYSKEICGGPHVASTGELGRFKVLKEEAVGQGVRRIRAIVEGEQ